MSLRSQSGQMITEAILILVLLMAITTMAAKYFKSNEVVKQLVSGPWQSLAGMIQNGVWAPPSKSSFAHPNGARNVSIKGEVAR